MAENVSYFFEGRTPAHHMRGDRVPEDVRARTVDHKVSLAKNGLGDCGEHHWRRQGIVWWTQIQEDPAMGAGWSAFFEITHQGFARIWRKRKNALAPFWAFLTGLLERL